MRTDSRPYRSIPTHEQQHGVRFARSSLRRVHPRGWDASSRLKAHGGEEQAEQHPH